MLRPVLLVMLAFAGDAAARCRAGHLSVHPATTEALPLRPMIIVEGYGNAADLLADAEAFRLRGPDGKVVPLTVVERTHGYQQKQLVLTAGAQLQPNAQYELTAPASAQKKLGDRPKFVWKTAAEADATAPSWESGVTAEKVIYEELGCGPELELPVLVDVKDASPVFFEVTLEHNGKTAKHYLTAHERKLFIGHGMCSGGFSMSNATKYAATIVPVDAAGNRGAAQKVAFETPAAR